MDLPISIALPLRPFLSPLRVLTFVPLPLRKVRISWRWERNLLDSLVTVAEPRT